MQVVGQMGMKCLQNAVVATLLAGLTIVAFPRPVAGAAGETTAQANGYAAGVLSVAPLPPGADRALPAPTSVVAVTPTPFGFPTGRDQYDARGFFNVADTPTQVTAYIESHLPRGTAWTLGSGPSPTGVTQMLVKRVPFGPHAEFARDSYTIVPSGTGTEVRVDAEVVWVPSRPGAETAGSSGTVVVSGPVCAHSGRGRQCVPMTVRVRGRRAQRIREDFDHLARAPGPAPCQVSGGFTPGFHVEFPSTAKAPTLSGATTACGMVSVAMPHRPLPPLVDDCAFQRAVAAVLPAGKGGWGGGKYLVDCRS